MKGKHHSIIWLHINNSKKSNVRLSNASFFDRAMEAHDKALNAIYPTLFKGTPQENETFGTSGISPKECRGVSLQISPSMGTQIVLQNRKQLSPPSGN